MNSKSNFRFIDLFAGIGGFHCAVSTLGGKCVFVSEINNLCQKTYVHNFPSCKNSIYGDIKKIEPKDVPEFDMLCAGFPCQSFSKAGKRKGFDDETRGDLFSYTLKILKEHKECKYVLLENVKNLADNEMFWKVIVEGFSNLNYFITKTPIVLSPSEFGIPQNRDRVFILGIRKDIADKTIVDNQEITINDLCLDKHKKGIKLGDAFRILDEDFDSELIVSQEENDVLLAWDDFKQTIFHKKIDAPIWMEYFGEEYKSTRAFFKKVNYNSMPNWKQRFVSRNREFYLENKTAIDTWIKKWSMTNRNKIYRKFEWNCKNDCRSVKEGIIQIRHSGVRVKRPDFYPALVAVNNTPIVWSEKRGVFRRLSVKETARLQSFPEKYVFLGSKGEQYKQLGNSVNVAVVKYVAKGLINLERKEK